MNKITRFELIDDHGRQMVERDLASCEFYLQDEGRTLKVFISKKR